MQILLLGYMASGKSFIGKHLSKKLSLPFIDLDEYIEKEEKMTISNIFKEKGEIHFRLLEHKYLQELLISDQRFILSLGGGTPCYSNNMDLIKQYPKVVSIYLQAQVDTIVARLLKGKAQRPLVQGLADDQLTEFVAKHLFERRFYYEQAAYKVITDDKSLSEIINQITNYIK